MVHRLHEHFVRRHGGYFCGWWWEERLGGASLVGLVVFMVGSARCRETCLSPLRQGTGLGVRVLDIAVGICVCGRVCLGGHDPGKGREGRVDTGGRMGAAMAAEMCLGHVKKLGCEASRKRVFKRKG